jgi:hypothetical protein
MSDRLRQIIGWWQFVCGILGLLLFAALGTGVLPGGFAAWYGALNVALGAVYFAAAILSGWGLLRRAAWALPLAIACQAMQVVSGGIRGGPHIAIAAGPMLGVTVTNSSVELAAGFNAAFFLGTRLQGPAWAMTINGLALAWTIALSRGLRAARRASPAGEIAAPVA